jgi:hypothetical protein
MIAWGGGYMGSVGGIQALIGHITGAPKIMFVEFQGKGLQRCHHVKSKFRWVSGAIEEGTWLIIGTEGQTGLALQGDDKIIHIPKDGYFLKARLKPDPEKASWESVQLKGWAMTEKKCTFWMANNGEPRIPGKWCGGRYSAKKSNWSAIYDRCQHGENHRAD